MKRLHHDEMGQATLLNLLLRNLLHDNLVEQAYKLLSKTSFLELLKPFVFTIRVGIFQFS